LVYSIVFLLTVNSVFQEYYQTHQLKNTSPSTISWIGSIQIFFLFGGNLFGGPLFDRLGVKVSFSAELFLLAMYTDDISSR
jgi:MFS family permease